MKTIFFATRTLARNAAKELNGKCIDCGNDSPTGERWAVLVEDSTHAAYNETQEQQRNNLNVEKLVEAQDNLVDSIHQVQKIESTAQKERNVMQNEINEMQHNLRLQSLASSGTMPAVSFTSGLKQRANLTSVNGKPVKLLVRRSQVAVRLAKHLANNA